jgi:hypothetical protein
MCSSYGTGPIKCDTSKYGMWMCVFEPKDGLSQKQRMFSPPTEDLIQFWITLMDTIHNLDFKAF